MRLRFAVVLGVWAASCLCVGCGRKSDVPLARVSGKVTLNGVPARGEIVFAPQTPGSRTSGRPSRGATRPDGTFTLYFGENQPGAILGHHQVTVTASMGTNTSTESAVAKVAHFDREVVSGKPNVFSFELNY